MVQERHLQRYPTGESLARSAHACAKKRASERARAGRAFQRETARKLHAPNEGERERGNCKQREEEPKKEEGGNSKRERRKEYACFFFARASSFLSDLSKSMTVS